MIGQALLSHLSRVGDLWPDDREAILESVRGERQYVPPGARGHQQGGIFACSSAVVVTGFLQRHVSRSDGSRQIHCFYIAGDAPSLEILHLDYLDSNLSAAIASEVALIPHARASSADGCAYCSDSDLAV